VKGAVPMEQIEPGLSPSAGQPGPVATALAGLIAIAAGLGIGRFVYTPILPPMIEALGLTKSQAGLIASANFAGYLIGALVAATPGLAGSRRLWLLGALAMSGVTTAAMGLTHNLTAFLVFRALGGAASAFVLIFSSAVVLERLAVAGRSGLSALHFAGVGSGIALSAALVAELLKLEQSWQSLWLASGGLTIAALVAAAMLLPDSSAPTDDSGPRAKSGPDRNLQRLAIAYGLFGFGYVITATFLVAIVRATPAIRTIEPVIWMVFGIAAVPSVALWTRLAASLGIPTTFAAACVVEAAGVLASVIWPSALGVFVAAVLVGGTFMGLTALGLMGARARTTDDPRRAIALMTGAFGVGQIVGPLFAGILSDHLGSFMTPSIVAALALVIAAGLAAM